MPEHRPPSPPGARRPRARLRRRPPTASRSTLALGLQNRCSTPRPVGGARRQANGGRIADRRPASASARCRARSGRVARSRCSRSPRTKPTSVIRRPARRATASAVGALTATSAPNPAAHAFCTISTRRPAADEEPERRSPASTPVEQRARRPPCRRRCGGRRPRGVTEHLAGGVERRRRVHGARSRANRPWPSSTRCRHRRRARRAAIGAVGAGSGASRASMLVELVAAAPAAARRRGAEPGRRRRRPPAGLDRDDVELALRRAAPLAQ